MNPVLGPYPMPILSVIEGAQGSLLTPVGCPGSFGENASEHWMVCSGGSSIEGRTVQQNFK